MEMTRTTINQDSQQPDVHLNLVHSVYTSAERYY